MAVWQLFRIFFSPLYLKEEFFRLFFFSSNAFFFHHLSSLRFTLVVVVFPIYIYCGCCFDHHDEHGGAKVVFEFPTRRIRSNARRNNNNNNNKEKRDFKTLLGEFTSSKIRGRVDSHQRVV